MKKTQKDAVDKIQSLNIYLKMWRDGKAQPHDLNDLIQEVDDWLQSLKGADKWKEFRLKHPEYCKALNELSTPPAQSETLYREVNKPTSIMAEDWSNTKGGGVKARFIYLEKVEDTPQVTQQDTPQVGQTVPNLSELGKTEKDKFILDFVQLTAKNVLSVFVALGLKTYIEATVVNDADGNTYKLSFRNIQTTIPKMPTEEEIGKQAEIYVGSMNWELDEELDPIGQALIYGALWMRDKLTTPKE